MDEHEKNKVEVFENYPGPIFQIAATTMFFENAHPLGRVGPSAGRNGPLGRAGGPLGWAGGSLGALGWALV